MIIAGPDSSLPRESSGSKYAVLVRQLQGLPFKIIYLALNTVDTGH